MNAGQLKDIVDDCFKQFDVSTTHEDCQRLRNWCVSIFQAAEAGDFEEVIIAFKADLADDCEDLGRVVEDEVVLVEKKAQAATTLATMKIYSACLEELGPAAIEDIHYEDEEDEDY